MNLIKDVDGQTDSQIKQKQSPPTDTGTHMIIVVLFEYWKVNKNKKVVGLRMADRALMKSWTVLKGFFCLKVAKESW